MAGASCDKPESTNKYRNHFDAVKFSLFLTHPKNNKLGGPWLARLVEPRTLDFRVLSSSPTWGMETT